MGICIFTRKYRFEDMVHLLAEKRKKIDQTQREQTRNLRIKNIQPWKKQFALTQYYN